MQQVEAAHAEIAQGDQSETRFLPILVVIGLVLVLVLVGGTSVPLAQAASYPTTIAQWTQVSAPGGTWNLFLFGGWTPPYVYRGDSWLYNGDNWRDATPVGPGPASRSKAGMAYDAARNRVVLFGGLYDIGNDRHFLNDTWQYADGTWTELHPPLSPSTRGDTLMVYDSRRDVMVLFGGGQNARPCPECTADNADTDTWEYYDETWHQVVTVHSPPRFRNGVMAYDEARGKVVLFTGFQACGFGWQNETWEYDGHDWARILSSQLGGVLRYDPGMAYDANRQRVVLFGGYPHGYAGCSLNDTWEYDGTAWIQITPPTRPSGRCSPAMGYDPGLRKVVMFAGGAGVPPEDTWEYDGVNWQRVFPQVHPPSRGWGMMAPILVAPTNRAPVLTVSQASVTVAEGQTATNSGTVSDPDGDPVTLSASIGMVINNSDGTWSWSFLTSDGPDNSQTVTISADDGHGGLSQAMFELVVNNVAPTVGAITAPMMDPVPVNTGFNVNAGFSDPGVLDTHTAVWDWGDGTTSDGTVSETNGSGSVSGSHIYLSPGVYTIKLTVTDKDGGSADSVVSVAVIPQLTVLNPAGVWIGLKNSDDVGTRFDLRAEVCQNRTTLIATGELDSVWGGSSGFNNARLNTIPLTLIGPVGWPEGSTLTFKRNLSKNRGKLAGRLTKRINTLLHAFYVYVISEPS